MSPAPDGQTPVTVKSVKYSSSERLRENVAGLQKGALVHVMLVAFTTKDRNFNRAVFYVAQNPDGEWKTFRIDRKD